MIKRVNDSKRRGQQKSTSEPVKKVIGLSDGWRRIEKLGIEPYLQRIENVLSKQNEKKLEAVSVPKQEFIETYDTIFSMCIQRDPDNYSSALYSKYLSTLRKHFQTKLVAPLEQKKEEDAIHFLREFVLRWRGTQWVIRGMRAMFQYLDRFHVPNSSEELQDLITAGYRLFYDAVFLQFEEKIVECILECIRRQREGEDDHQELLRESVSVFIELDHRLHDKFNIYSKSFHSQFIAESKLFYRQQSKLKLNELSCSEYLLFAEECLKREEERHRLCLNNKTSEYKQELITVLQQELLMSVQSQLLNMKSGLHHLLEKQLFEPHFRRLFELFEVIPSGNLEILKQMKQFIVSCGDNLIEEKQQNPNELISCLIDLHETFHSLITQQCNASAPYYLCLKQSFELFLNRKLFLASFLARFCNDLLSKGAKKSALNLEQSMQNIVRLYGYLRDKDVFENEYQQYLAHRLLMDLSANLSSESAMIGKLKNAAGYYWTQKLESMFKDLQQSQDLMAQYEAKEEENSIDLNVTVCTTGCWPTAWSTNNSAVIKSKEIQAVIDHFTAFYLDRFNGRRLNFRMDKGRAECWVRFNAKTKKILVVSTYQMLALLLFNDKSKKFWTFQQIEEATHIPTEELKAALLSMVHPKIKILRKAPNNKSISGDHKFQINPNYSNQRTRIIVPTLRFEQKKSAEELNELSRAVILSRRHQTDAAIVRILKARQSLSHNLLIGEVHKQLVMRFTPKPIEVKKRIEALIDAEYLMRDPQKRDVYKYLQ